jgi:hypothetical protein
MPIQGLPSNTTCNLFGWGQTPGTNPRSESVSIYRSEFCDPAHPQVSCSTFASTGHEFCNAELGSPVLCDGNTRFTGFMTSNGCVQGQNQAVINYQSVNAIRRWFEEVIATDDQRTTNFAVRVMELVGGNIATERVRCVGTVITDHHLLTAATCVIVPENSQFSIAVHADWDGLGRATSKTDLNLK